MAEAKWYVVHTYSGYENKVKANIEQSIQNLHLEDQILDVQVPMQDVVEVKNGQKVKAGQLLMKFDLDELKKEGFDMVTPIVITNSTEFTLDTASKGRVKVGDRVMTLAAQEG